MSSTPPHPETAPQASVHPHSAPGDGPQAPAHSAPAAHTTKHSQATRPAPPVSVVILTLNEEINIRAAIESCQWCDDIHVLDSGSTDQTQTIAREMGATVHSNPFTSFGEQRNWAIDNIPTKHPWIFHLDADERFTDKLVKKITKRLSENVEEAGFHIPSKTMFMGRWLKRSAKYPTYQMRLFHKDRMRFIDYGHGQREEESAQTSIIDEPYLHFSFSKGIYDWLEKHNRYSTLEALQITQGKKYHWKLKDLLFGKKLHRWRAWKEISYHLPMRSRLRWINILFVNGGILEGRAALTYANLIGMYENMTMTKVRVLRSRTEINADPRPLPKHESVPNFEPTNSLPNQAKDRAKQTTSTGDTHDNRHVPHAPDAPPTSRDTSDLMKAYNLDHLPQMRPESSPWSFKGKLARAIWMTFGSKLFRFSFHNWYRYRRNLLRLFGAKVGQNVAIRPSAHIEIPWTLTIEDGASIGDKAIIYSLGHIHIGKRAIISQYAHLCAGTHDYTDHTFKLIRTPITIGDDCWVGADAFIGPSVTVGALSVIGARSSVYKDIPPGKVAVGNPAKVIKDRKLK